MGAVKLCDRGSTFCSQNCPDPAMVLTLYGYTVAYSYLSFYLYINVNGTEYGGI